MDTAMARATESLGRRMPSLGSAAGVSGPIYPRRFLLAATPLLAIAGVASYAALKLAPESFETTARLRALGGPDGVIGGPFELIDHRGRLVTDAAYRGRLMLIYFGYSGCPDICPMRLGELSAALDLAGPDAADVAFLFITVDPVRDTPEQLAGYVTLFHSGLTGLSGSEAQCERAATAYRVYRNRRSGPEPGDYTIEHASFAYLVGRDGRLLTVFAQGAEPERIAQTIRDHARTT